MGPRRLVFGPPDPPFENPSNSQWAGFHFVGSTTDLRKPFSSRSVAEPIESLQLQVLDKTQISIFAEASPPKSRKTSSETWKMNIGPNISRPTTLKRTQCSGRQHQSAPIHWPTRRNRNMRNCPPLGVLSSPYKLQHMDTSRANREKIRPWTTPYFHSCCSNFDTENIKNVKS